MQGEHIQMMFEPLPASRNMIACKAPTQMALAPFHMRPRSFFRQGTEVFPVIVPPMDGRFTTRTDNAPTLMENREEKRIIEAVLAGNVAQFGSLVERYQKPIYSFMLRLTNSPSDAEDLTQEVFVRAFEKLRKFKNNRRFFPWLYTIAVNRGRDHLRKKGLRRKLFTEESENSENQDSAADDCRRKPECAMIVAEIVDAMEKLPLSYREPLLLYYREEFSIKEISVALKISDAAVKVRLHRGREMLRRLMGEQNAIDQQ
jgi:RNA polymerase sigma-70 factor (ECF subfamily)